MVVEKTVVVEKNSGCREQTVVVEKNSGCREQTVVVENKQWLEKKQWL